MIQPNRRRFIQGALGASALAAPFVRSARAQTAEYVLKFGQTVRKLDIAVKTASLRAALRNFSGSDRPEVAKIGLRSALAPHST